MNGAERAREPGASSGGLAAPLDATRLAQAVGRLAAADADLAAVVARHGSPPLWARRPGFPTLLRIILEQQVSLSSARAAYERLRNELGRLTPRTVAARGAEGLRQLGLTRQKAAYCHGLAVRVASGGLALDRLAQCADEEARGELLAVPGIGPWSADVYLLMALGRPDVWPAGDLALLSALGSLRRLGRRPTPQEGEELAARWTPWRGAAARILWHGYLEGSLRS